MTVRQVTSPNTTSTPSRLMARARIFYLSHGGGPLPLLGDPGHAELVAHLEEVAAQLPRPDAIVVVSAHWEEVHPTVTSGAAPELIYDYFGFPPESYDLRYSAPGHPELAKRLAGYLADAGFAAQTNATRGFDHGLFVPLTVMFPEAVIPCIQLSLLRDLSPERHLAMGEALNRLRDENLLLVGSGFSFHNMRAFFAPPDEATETANKDFEFWLQETLASSDLGSAGKDDCEVIRRARLVDWAAAPGARFCHPREEHLLPLHVCYGMAGRACSQAFSLRVLGKQASAFLW